MHAVLRDRGWIMKHMKTKRLMHDPAMHLLRTVSELRPSARLRLAICREYQPPDMSGRSRSSFR